MVTDNLLQQLGGIKTKFLFSSNNKPLEIDNQIIILRANYEVIASGTVGISNQSYHIEFITRDVIDEKKEKTMFEAAYYQVGFYDKTHGFLGKISVVASYVKLITFFDESRYAYSVNLYQMPLIILESVAEIDICKIV